MSSEHIPLRAARSSDASSTVSSDDQIHDIVADEPLYYVLMQFLMTEDGRNIASVLSDLSSEVKQLRTAMDKMAVGGKKERRESPEPREPRRESRRESREPRRDSREPREPRESRKPRERRDSRD